MDRVSFRTPDRDYVEYLAIQEKSILTIRDERDVLRQSAAQVKSAGNLGDKPLIVLTAGVRQPSPGQSVPGDEEAFPIFGSKTCSPGSPSFSAEAGKSLFAQLAPDAIRRSAGNLRRHQAGAR